MKIPILLQTILKHFFGVLLALGFSATLSILVILYTPILFKLAFNEISELAANYKDVEMNLYKEHEFRDTLGIPAKPHGDKAIFDWIIANNPDSIHINNFFSRGIKTRQVETCYYNIYGKHRVLDFFWIIEVKHCKPDGRQKSTENSEVSH
jgi:hypothetical protein